MDVEKGEERNGSVALKGQKQGRNNKESHSSPCDNYSLQSVARAWLCQLTYAQISSNSFIYYSIDEQPNGQWTKKNKDSFLAKTWF